MLEYGLIIGVVLFYFYSVTCTFLAVQIARLKGRRRAWGWLGLFLGLIGLLIICFLPNAKGVTGETNPVKMLLRKLTAVSPVVTWIFVAGMVLVVGGTLIGTRLSTYFEDRAHEKELTGQTNGRQTLSPAVVSGGVANVFCGSGNNFAITQTGALYGWGAIEITALDESGKLYENAMKVQTAGDTCFVLTNDHILYARGDNQKGIIPGQTAAWVESFVQVEPNVKDFSVSETAGALVKENGNLYVFGSNIYGQLGLGVEKVTDTNSRLAQNVTKVVVTARSLYYLAADGNVYATGSNAYGQFGIGNKEVQAVPVLIGSGCKDMAAGDDFTLLLKTDGTVWSAGSDSLGQLGRVTLEESEIKVALEDGTLPPPAATAFGQITELTEVTAVKAGGSTALALIGMELYGWGDNRVDQLGSSDPLFYTAPKSINKKTVLFDTSGSCTLIYTQEGKLLGAGDRRNHQLGADGNETGFSAVATVKEANP